MRQLMVAAFVAGIFLCNIASLRAQSDGAPADCFFDCKEQVELLGSLGDFTSDEAIAKAFGKPTEVAKGNKNLIELYRGKDVDLLFLKAAKTRKPLGVAVYLTGRATSAVVPYFAGISLADVNLKFIREECEDQRVDGVDARYAYFWTPKCYFGRPGNYKNFTFLLTFSYDCKGVKDAFDPFAIKQLKCPSDKEPRVHGVFVTSDERPETLARAITSFVYWREID